MHGSTVYDCVLNLFPGHTTHFVAFRIMDGSYDFVVQNLEHDPLDKARFRYNAI